MTSANFWPILVASIVAFGIGALWYSPILFGKEWMALMKIKESDVAAAKEGGMAKLYLAQFVMTLVSFGVLAFLLANTASRTAGDGIFMGLIVWVGFVLPTGVSSLLWEKRPLKLVLINTLSVLVNLLVGGAIVGAWR
jgi:hypothetical protein